MKKNLNYADTTNRTKVEKLFVILSTSVILYFGLVIIGGITDFFARGIFYLMQINILGSESFLEPQVLIRSISEWCQVVSILFLGTWLLFVLKTTQFRVRIRKSKRLKRIKAPTKLFASPYRPKRGTFEFSILVFALIATILNTPFMRRFLATAFPENNNLLYLILSGLELVGVIFFFIFWTLFKTTFPTYPVILKATKCIRIGNILSLFLAFTIFYTNLNTALAPITGPILPKFMLNTNFIYITVLLYSLGSLIFKSIGNRSLMDLTKNSRPD